MVSMSSDILKVTGRETATVLPRIDPLVRFGLSSLSAPVLGACAYSIVRYDVSCAARTPPVHSRKTSLEYVSRHRSYRSVGFPGTNGLRPTAIPATAYLYPKAPI